MNKFHVNKADGTLDAPRRPENPAPRMAATYDELRRIAAHLRRKHGDPTLQTTELVHETFIRLAETGPEKYRSRAYYFEAVGRAMYSTLIDRARKRRAQKRGFDWPKVPLEDAELGTPVLPTFDELYAALDGLAALDPRLRRVIEMRFLAGMSVREVADRLRRGESTIRRDCAFAKAWLRRQLVHL